MRGEQSTKQGTMSAWHCHTFLLVLILSSFNVCVVNGFTAPYYVYVVNGLTNYTLNVHCKSRDDDLGVHALPINTEFHWKFRVNLIFTTLFSCNTWCVKGRSGFIAFEFEYEFLNDCYQQACIWKAFDDGMYKYNVNNHSMVKKYDWGK